MRSWLLLACLFQLGIDTSLGWNRQSRWGGQPQQPYYPPMREPPQAPPPRQVAPSRNWNMYTRGGPMYDPNPQEGYPGPPILTDPGYLNFRKFRAIRCNPPPTPPPNYYRIRNLMYQNPRLDISVNMPDHDLDCECMHKTWHRLYQPEYIVKPEHSRRCNDQRQNNMVCVCSAPDLPEPQYYPPGYGQPGAYGGHRPPIRAPAEQAVPGARPHPYTYQQRYPRY